MPFTLEELERRAYISGDVEKAGLLARAIEGDDEESERAQYLEEENDRLQREVDDLQAELDEVRAELEASRA